MNSGKEIGRIRLATSSRTGLSALVNKLHIGNIIQQSHLVSIY